MDKNSNNYIILTQTLGNTMQHAQGIKVRKQESRPRVPPRGYATIWINQFGAPQLLNTEGRSTPLDTSALSTDVPATPTAAGTPGHLAADANYLYFCYALNKWARIAAASTW